MRKVERKKSCLRKEGRKEWKQIAWREEIRNNSSLGEEEEEGSKGMREENGLGDEEEGRKDVYMEEAKINEAERKLPVRVASSPPASYVTVASSQSSFKSAPPLTSQYLPVRVASSPPASYVTVASSQSSFKSARLLRHSSFQSE
ncbi:hypothetical protein Pcinc_023015 [Petrolisthes cinctipes]|uniref:Uncharacterized protein n=1 Tax=Petrolisthes cinctipes TaxID=88211 RepID=A0AAE1FD27_PETCI|nr:hypothetical protein Pcinc_023015 [Petrolisthes cinctipes]